MKLTPGGFDYIGRCLEAFLFGLYSAIFVMYLQYHSSRKDTGRATNILFYALCILYALSGAVVILDIATLLIIQTESLYITSSTIFGCCDFISQSILIYRCWIVWGRNIRVVIIPIILAFVFLATWLAGNSSIYMSEGQLYTLKWGNTTTVTSLAISMIVNALVMGLIVMKIFKVFRVVKATSAEQRMGATGGSKLRSMIFILIESGMTLFSIQLARLVVAILANIIPHSVAALDAFALIAGIHQMLNGITPTIILVRVSMGLSFHDENSMVEATASLCFARDHPKFIETGSSATMAPRESGDKDIGVPKSDDIEMADK